MRSLKKKYKNSATTTLLQQFNYVIEILTHDVSTEMLLVSVVAMCKCVRMSLKYLRIKI